MKVGKHDWYSFAFETKLLDLHFQKPDTSGQGRTLFALFVRNGLINLRGKNETQFFLKEINLSPYLLIHSSHIQGVTKMCARFLYFIFWLLS